MRRSIATVCLSGTLEDKLEAIAAARFDGVEIFENDLIYFDGSPRDVRRMAADLGLSIDLYQPFRDFEGVSDTRFKRNLERIERKFDLMEELGTNALLVCSNVSPDTIDDDARAAAQLHELAERAAKRNILVGYEALAWGTHVNRYGHAWSLVKKVDHPHLGVLLDSFHILSRGDDPAGIADIPGDKIAFLQLADAPYLAMDVLQWSRHYRCFPGQGQFDLARFMEYVLLAGYSGPLSLEVFNDVFREAPNRRTAVDAMQSLLFLEEQARNRLLKPTGADAALDARRAQAAEQVELFAPPPAGTLDGVSFIEFAVDEAAAEALGKTLASFGFRKVGRHRSKQVFLYRQGEINLILNAEPDSFARRHFTDHGTSICALSLRADNPSRVLNRAVALLCPRHEGKVGPNERKIPAVQAPDGSLFYFVAAEGQGGDPYRTDFLLEEEGRPEGVGLLEVDHVAQGLPLEQLDTWVLFYRAVLGMNPGDSLELSDPQGLIRTRGIASENRRVRFVLNMSQSRSTQTARTADTLAGSSVHHIAFNCAHLMATVEAMRAQGVAFVPLSPNYYDDLPTRFELDDAFVARLRELGILYDRSAEGAYLHIYTEAFEDRFFFEFVQRIDGYDAYGAGNAPVRMASQARRQKIARA